MGLFSEDTARCIRRAVLGYAAAEEEPGVMPDLHVIAGPNGAGKTTFAVEFLRGTPFLNADEIAREISPENPASAAISAGREMLLRMDEYIRRRTTFAFEATLAGRNYRRRFLQAKDAGYSIHLYYLWLPDAEIALARVQDRVRRGYHRVPEADVRRRFVRSVQNSFGYYEECWNEKLLFDCSEFPVRPIFHRLGNRAHVFDEARYQCIMEEVERIRNIAP